MLEPVVVALAFLTGPCMFVCVRVCVCVSWCLVADGLTGHRGHLAGYMNPSTDALFAGRLHICVGAAHVVAQ